MFADGVERKERILEVLKKKNESGQITQPEILDLSQEYNRCEHIINHSIRAVKNPAGRYVCFAGFAIVGAFIGLARMPVRGGYNITNLGRLLFLTIGFGGIGYGYAVKFHSNPGDLSKFIRIKNGQAHVDAEFEDELKKSNKLIIKHNI